MSGDNNALFNFWIEQGWKQRVATNSHMRQHLSEYRERIKHEVNVIREKNFENYFLIVSDMIRWAKRQEIAVGPGRGSSAGSLVCYLLRITEIDPMQFPMLFERFLDPTRTDPPDIDTDYESDRRDEVFNYAATKYGKEHVGNILNITRYLGKSALDDVARVYHIPLWTVDAIKGKLISRAEGHPRFSKTLEDTFNTFPEIRELVDERPELAYAARLEGQIRGFNVHAAGMVITTVPLNDICATYEREINGQVRQAIPFDKRDAVTVGLLKIDALSLITMGEIADMCRMSGMTLEELYRIPLDDNETLQAFRDGDVLGIFQFEGNTTRRILKSVQPTKFMHLADVNALSRPGADDKGYIRNKNAGTWPEPPHEIIARHTNWTNGVIVYEEQILMVLRDLGGFAPAELNRMRKIIHDKLGGTAFNENFKRFVKGAATHGLSEDAAKSVWDGMVSASGYAFCVTGDCIVERGGVGGNEPKGSSPKITVAELYSRQESKTPIGKKIRAGRLSLLSMDDDGRIRTNRLLKIHDPVPYRCLKITTAQGRSLTMSNDHKILTVDGYKVAVSLVIGEQLVVDLGWAARDLERIQDLTKYRPFGYQGWDGIKGEGNPGWIDGRWQTLQETYDFVWKRDGASCKHCGKLWDGTQHGLEFAHVMTLEVYEGDYLKYNAPENVMLLCNSCHKKFDYRIQGTRNKRWSRGRPTGTDTIVSIKDVGIQDVYDISMHGPSHNYIGNEFVNHNNIGHSVPYAAIGYWQQYLKIHATAEFYTSKLNKCSDNVRRGKFIKEATRHKIDVKPPNIIDSGHNWTLSGRVIRAGFDAIEGIGPAKTQAIIDWRKSFLAEAYDPEWEDLLQVKGFGAKTVQKIVDFVESDDPFGVEKESRILSNIRGHITEGRLAGIPTPTHISIDVPPEKTWVTYIGIVRKRKYYDAVEQAQKRATEDISREDVLADLERPDLLKYAALYVEDEYGETIRVSISRWAYPKFQREIQSLKINRDVVVCQGFSSDWGGISIQVKNMCVLNPQNS